MILLSLVEKPRQYQEQEEPPEMAAARIDRDVVGPTFFFRSLPFFLKRKRNISWENEVDLNKDVLWKLYFSFSIGGYAL